MKLRQIRRALVSVSDKAGLIELAGALSAHQVEMISTGGTRKALVDAGFTPMEALQSVTVDAAQFLGRTDDFGTVANGKAADLVLLDANPLDDIHNTQKIRAIVVQGKYLDRAALDALLAHAKELASH